jgi:hypothetical protein
MTFMWRELVSFWLNLSFHYWWIEAAVNKISVRYVLIYEPLPELLPLPDNKNRPYTEGIVPFLVTELNAVFSSFQFALNDGVRGIVKSNIYPTSSYDSWIDEEKQSVITSSTIYNLSVGADSFAFWFQAVDITFLKGAMIWKKQLHSRKYIFQTSFSPLYMPRWPYSQFTADKNLLFKAI